MKERFACALYGESSMQWRRQLFLAEGECATRPVELPGTLAWLSPFDERNVRRTQRTRQLRRVRMAPEPATALFGVLLCLPTAPTLPKVTNENFATFSLLRQLSGQSLTCPLLFYVGAKT
jgi:hypothetical protein